MALLRNGGNLYSNTCRYFAASGVYALASAFDGGAAKRNWQNGEHRVTDVTDKSGLPNGYRPPVAWMLPQKAGAMSSRNEARLQIDGSASGALGKNSPAVATLTIDGIAVGGLIAGGVALGTITLTGTADIFAGIGGVATGSITLDGAATAGAVGHLAAGGVLSLSGSVVPYAIGHLGQATTDFGNEFSPSNLARAVWDAAAGDYNAAGSMGEKLNDAGSASNPWTEVIESGYTAAQILRLIAAATQGSAAGLESGAPVFKSLDGSKNRIEATYSSGTRTVTDRDAT